MSSAPPSRILDVGCGSNKMPGSIGIDCRPFAGVDVVHDLESIPWPFAADSFDLLVCTHVIEHMSDVGRFLREIHRISADGAEIRIATPHFSSLDSWLDPSHRQHLALESFGFFCADGYLNDGAVFRVRSSELTFRKALSSRLGAAMARWSPRLYEQNFAYLLPAREIRAVLQAVKSGGPQEAPRRA